MKKILLLASAVVGMLAAGSCQREIEYLDGDTKVTFEVSTGDLATKASAIADASNITVLHWELYGSDIRTAAAPYGEGTVTDTDGDKKFTVELRLVADQKYNIVFWAETEHGATHYETSDLRNVKIKTYADENANDESRAAFFAVHDFETQNGVNVNEEVTLYRPFAQINLGTTTYDTSLNLVNGGKVAVNSTQMTVTSVANVFNTLDGVGVAENFDGKVTFKAAATPNGEDDKTQELLTVNEQGYYWIGMNYLIVVDNAGTTDVDVVLNTNMGVVEHSIANVPIKENYRTNILGDFLTTGAKFNIVVDERFEVPEFVEDPYKPVNEKLYKAQTVDELLKYAYMVNYVDKTLELELRDDIALPQYEIAVDHTNQTYAYTTTEVTVENGIPSGSNWVGIGDYETSSWFYGKINGKGHTISGLRMTSTTPVTGFIGYAECGGTVVENLNLSDACVYGTNAYTGALVAWMGDGVVVRNCHLTNVHVLGKSTYAGAITSYDITRGRADDETCVIENCSVDATSTVTGIDYVGGISGRNYGSIMKKCYNAATITGTSCVGGLAGESRDYQNNLDGWMIACHNDGTVISSGKSRGGIMGQSFEGSGHVDSESYMVACWSTAPTADYQNLLVGACARAVSHYGSWGLKTTASQTPLPTDTYTSCYAFDSAASITQADIDAMNAAIDVYNTGRTPEDPTYCPYKWEWTAGSLPVLK